MKFHCKNELSLLSFDEAVVKEFKIEKDTIQMQFSGGVAVSYTHLTLPTN